jgi:hypothetical protein
MRVNLNSTSANSRRAAAPARVKLTRIPNLPKSRANRNNPSPGPRRLVKAPSRATLPDFWGPMDPIGVQKSDSPRERDVSPPPAAFHPKEWSVIQKYRTPRQVQAFLRDLPYNWEKGGETLRTFRSVVRHWSAHCLEGALTAAAILEQHGYPPLLLDLESQDKLDHVLFLFRQRGRWGTVARSRDAGLHGRKPLFPTIRQLVMSYVDPYVDGSGRITGYGVGDLRTLVKGDWRLSEKNIWEVERALIKMPHKKLKTSDRRYTAMLKQYRAYRVRHPEGPVTFYSDKHLWL